MATDIVLLEGVRTGFGAFGGSLKEQSATDLGVIAAKGALERAQVAPAWIDHTIFGNVIQTSPDAIYLARHIGLKSGVPIEKPAVTLNRLCGSGQEAIVMGARLLLTGEANFVLTGGTESMSQSPHVVRGARSGIAFGANVQFEDMLWTALVDSYTGQPMAITAENLAEQYHITREEQDRFALRDQQLAKQAWDAGRMKDEIVPVPLKDRKGNVTMFAKDEAIRLDATIEGLAKLPARFKKEGGTVTAGNASGIVDGAAAVVVTTLANAQ
ncbi:MAG: acetyl-CoA C-acyltransferase, partial [Anaerolineales bacterium]|nr:acetyl-CoA C-acyltransferase [Anaerolineales bacterium]